MLLKDADDRTQDLEILGRLMKDSNTPDATKRKTDQFVSRLDREFDAQSPIAMAKVVSQDTLEALARQIMALHR